MNDALVWIGYAALLVLLGIGLSHGFDARRDHIREVVERTLEHYGLPIEWAYGIASRVSAMPDMDDEATGVAILLEINLLKKFHSVR